jgi:hypothetical protein
MASKTITAAKVKQIAKRAVELYTAEFSGAYVHPTGDGNSHVPLDGGSNDGKVLSATTTAGAPAWTDIDGGFF